MNNEKGFTITELLVVILLSTIVAAVVFTNFGFIHKQAAKWKQGVGEEQEIALLITKLKYKTREIAEIDSISKVGLWYKDRQGVSSVILLTETGLKELKADINWDRIHLDSGLITPGSTLLENDRNNDHIVDFTDLDVNMDGKITEKETKTTDFVDFSIAFTYGNKRFYSTSFCTRLRRIKWEPGE